jgi:hypothetical protein
VRPVRRGCPLASASRRGSGPATNRQAARVWRPDRPRHRPPLQRRHRPTGGAPCWGRPASGAPPPHPRRRSHRASGRRGREGRQARRARCPPQAGFRRVSSAGRWPRRPDDQGQLPARKAKPAGGPQRRPGEHGAKGGAAGDPPGPGRDLGISGARVSGILPQRTARMPGGGVALRPPPRIDAPPRSAVRRVRRAGGPPRGFRRDP